MPLALLSLVKSKLFGVALFVMAGLAFYGYVRWTDASMAAMRQSLTLISKQADDLKAANTVIRQQIDDVLQEQKQVQAQMDSARAQAASAVRSVRALNLHKAASSNPTALEDQINTAWSARSQKIEDASHVR